MELVGRVGTAKALTTNASSRVKLPANYRMIYKTGTIVEGNEGRESEALMFVIGRWVLLEMRPSQAFYIWRSQKTRTRIGRMGI